MLFTAYGLRCCFYPVLSLADAPLHPHKIARRTFIRIADRI